MTHSDQLLKCLIFIIIANKKYKNKIIQLGENSKNIHVVGGLGADSLNKIKCN